VLDVNFPDALEVAQFGFSVTRTNGAVQWALGASVHITADEAALLASLYQIAQSGSPIGNAQFQFATNPGDNEVVPMVLQTTGTVVSVLSSTTTDKGAVTLVLGFTFSTIELDLSNRTADGTLENEVSSFWDLSATGQTAPSSGRLTYQLGSSSTSSNETIDIDSFALPDGTQPGGGALVAFPPANTTNADQETVNNIPFVALGTPKTSLKIDVFGTPSADTVPPEIGHYDLSNTLVQSFAISGNPVHEGEFSVSYDASSLVFTPGNR